MGVPDEPALRMPDPRFSTALRARLSCPRPAACDLNSGITTHCQHRYADSGVVCGCILDDQGRHAATCPVGGGPERGHNAIVEWLAAWLTEQTGWKVLTEQWVAEWTRLDGEGGAQLGRLDVPFTDHAGTKTYADVCVPAAYTTDDDERDRRAQEDGRAAALACDEKRRRYPASSNPTCSLVPFVVEALGRPSEDAVGLLRAMAAGLPKNRGATLDRAWRRLSVLVQTRLAENLLAAEQPRAPR